MKAKQLSLAIAALLAAGGVWFVGFHKSRVGELPRGQAMAPSSILDHLGRANRPAAGPENYRASGAKPGQMLRPPDPNRHFTDFTPEQRVEFARKGHGPGG